MKRDPEGSCLAARHHIDVQLVFAAAASVVVDRYPTPLAGHVFIFGSRL